MVAVEVVDHVEPHHGDMVKFWNTALWQAACKWHHDVVKQVLERLFAQGKARLDDLWLDSDKAKELTIALRPPGGG